MYRLNKLGRRFNETEGFEFDNYDQPYLPIYLHDTLFVKDQVYRVIFASADAHGYRKSSVISFLKHYQKLGVTPDDTFAHSPSLQRLFNDFIVSLIDGLKLDQLGGKPFSSVNNLP
jgi:hypothetical protein